MQVKYIYCQLRTFAPKLLKTNENNTHDKLSGQNIMNYQLHQLYLRYLNFLTQTN